jgi:stearoyl-CoA desaturase (delta-9 desaturase)
MPWRVRGARIYHSPGSFDIPFFCLMSANSTVSKHHDDIIYPSTIPFILVHLACVAAIWSGVTSTALVLATILYVVRMFGVTGGYHRYFSHRSFKTSRWFQFVLAFIAQSSAQKSSLWWASIHRHHHKHSDTEDDVHSPRHRGMLYSHVGWIFDKNYRHDAVPELPEFMKYPELRFLHRFELFPAIVLAVACFLFAGWSGLVVGFFWSTVALYHGTFFINSLAHGYGNQRYVTGDDSRNNWWLAIITLGEGWHNNHHAYQRSARQGFRWYEVDITFYVLTALSWVGIVRDLGTPPIEVVRNERPLARSMIERIARQLAETHTGDLSLERMRARAKAMIPHTPSLDEICQAAIRLVETRRLETI